VLALPAGRQGAVAGSSKSAIFAKIGSSVVVKIHQDKTFRLFESQIVGGTQCRPLIFHPPKRGSLSCDFEILSFDSICFAFQKEFLL
jgi:hypothetical protein